MKEALAEPRKELSQYAPRIITMKIRPDQIRDLIGTGGKIHPPDRRRRRGSTSTWKMTVRCSSPPPTSKPPDRAIAMVKWLTEEAEIGRILHWAR